MKNVNLDPLPTNLLVASTLLTTVVATQENAGSQPGSDTSDLIFPIIIGVLGILGGICATVGLFKIWSSRQSDVSASLVTPPPPPSLLSQP
jgi:hypothetical protein